MITIIPRQKEDEKFLDYRSRVGLTAGFTGLFLNIFLFSVKLAIGFFIGSLSVIGEAVNNLSDVGSSLVTILGFWIAKKPADDEHPAGHARWEYLFSLAVSVIIIFISFSLGKESIIRIINPKLPKFSTITFFVLIISVLMKLFLSSYYEHLGKKIQSTILIAQAVDSRSDILSTVAVLIGVAVQNFVSFPVDGVLGLVVSIFIFRSGFEVIKEPLDHLIGAAISDEEKERITNFILSEKRILGIHDLIVHDYGPMRTFATVHAEVDSKENLSEINLVIDEVETKALEELGLELTIHVDPIVIGNERVDAMKEDVRLALIRVDDRLSFHDFRVVENSKVNLIFDVEIPTGVNTEAEEINGRVGEELKKINPLYNCIITFDRKYYRYKVKDKR